MQRSREKSPTGWDTSAITPFWKREFHGVVTRVLHVEECSWPFLFSALVLVAFVADSSKVVTGISLLSSLVRVLFHLCTVTSAECPAVGQRGSFVGTRALVRVRTARAWLVARMGAPA